MKNVKFIVRALIVFVSFLISGQAVSAQEVATSGGGNATITIENAAQSQTYTLYKLFDAKVGSKGAIAYTVPSGKTLSSNDYFTVDSKGNVTAKADIDVSTDAFKTWAKSFGTQVATTTSADNTLTFTGLSYGYYYVQSSLGTTITVDSTNPNATLKDKNETGPKIPDSNAGGGKKILVNGQPASESTAKVGDTVNYQIKFEATNHITTAGGASSQLITKYTIVDTPTNLTLDDTSVAVTVGGKTITNFTKAISDTGAMTLELPWINNGQSIYDSPSEVVITYTAKVTKEAHDAQAQNKATISYSTTETDTPTPVDPKTPEYITVVTTHQFTLNKTDENGKALTGATFRLYDAQTGGNEIKVVKVSDGVYRVAEDGEAGVDIEAGTAVVKGLKADTTYYLEETKAPNGYNILTERKAVTVTKDDAAKVTVENHSGAELPSTGSYGTTIFYVVGSVLILGVLIYVIASRRVKKD